MTFYTKSVCKHSYNVRYISSIISNIRKQYTSSTEILEFVLVAIAMKKVKSEYLLVEVDDTEQRGKLSLLQQT